MTAEPLERSSLPPTPWTKGPTGTVTVQVGEARYVVELVQGKAMAWSKPIAQVVAGMDAEWLSAEFKRQGWKATFRSAE